MFELTTGGRFRIFTFSDFRNICRNERDSNFKVRSTVKEGASSRKGGRLWCPLGVACLDCWFSRRWGTLLPVAGLPAGDGGSALPLPASQGDGRGSFSGIDVSGGAPGAGSCGFTKAFWSPLARWEVDLLRPWRLSPATAIGAEDDGIDALEFGGC